MDKKNEIRKKRYKMLQWILGKSLKLDYAISDKRETSISDSTNYGYTPFCEQASRSSRIFKNFRHYNVYRGIVEDVGYDIGVGCWNIIQTKNVSDGVLEECWKNDTVGGAETYFYEGLKKPVAPATMRYAKIMLELKELFGELKNVVEIGVGYGGQSRILRRFNSIQSYGLVDIPQALGVSKKYLSRFFSDEEMKQYHFINGTTLKKTLKPEFVMSNYAFSELCREVQDVYLEHIITHARKGYITWNELSHSRLNGHSIEEVCAMIPGSEIIDEIPLSAEGNQVILWGANPEAVSRMKKDEQNDKKD